MGRLQAGVARRSIVPPRGVFLVGYGDRTFGNCGVLDETLATAMVLDDGSGSAAIVGLDLLTVCERTTDRIRERLDPLPVLLCCSHTHSGPISFADQRSARRDRRYVDGLVDRIVDAVHDAANRLQPARLEWSLGECDLGVNRRQVTSRGIEIGENLAGPCDRSIGVLGVIAESGQRLASVVTYACHGTVLGPRHRQVSSDWIGAMRRRVEAALGGVVVFVQGAGANVNPRVSWDVADPVHQVEESGARVADAVFAAVAREAAPIEARPISIVRRDVWIPLQVEATAAVPPKAYLEPLLAMAGLPKIAAPLGEPLLRRRYPWSPTIEARDGRWCVPMRHSVLRLGDVAVIAYGAETFTELGLAAKAASPARATIFASVTDGCISYLTTTAAHDEGGYEVEVAPWAYRYPGLLDPGGEQLAHDATVAALAELWA